jgi:ATP-dependent RNA helicase RhlE
MAEQTDKKTKKKYYDHISVAKRTKQLSHFVLPHDKPAMLEQIIKNTSGKNIVIITKNKRSADELNSYLKSKDITAIAIHGNHRAEQQTDAAKAFNAGEINILITTDMILKALELNTIDKIISYDLPVEPNDYYARVLYVDERGESISLVSPEDEKLLVTIEFLMKVEMLEVDVKDFVPSTEDAPKPAKNKKKKPRHTKKRVQKNTKSTPQE